MNELREQAPAEIWAIRIVNRSRSGFLVPIDDDGTDCFLAWPTREQAEQGLAHQRAMWLGDDRIGEVGQMNPITFFVDGKPMTAGSKKWMGNAKSTGRPILVDDAKNLDWKNAVTRAARQAYPGPPLLGPLVLEITFQLQRPASHYGSGRNAHLVKASAPDFPEVKPDACKLTRCLEDALTGIIWRDDAQVVKQLVSKDYGDRIGAAVTIYPAEVGMRFEVSRDLLLAEK